MIWRRYLLGYAQSLGVGRSLLLADGEAVADLSVLICLSCISVSARLDRTFAKHRRGLRTLKCPDARIETKIDGMPQKKGGYSQKVA